MAWVKDRTTRAYDERVLAWLRLAEQNMTFGQIALRYKTTALEVAGAILDVRREDREHEPPTEKAA